MPLLRLAEADRTALAEYDVPETVEYQPGQYGMKAVGELRRQTGYTYARLEAGLDGITAVRDGVETVEYDITALLALCWLILWDSGVRIPWESFDLRGVPQFLSDPGVEASEGKAEGPTGEKSERAPATDNTNSSSSDTSQD